MAEIMAPYAAFHFVRPFWLLALLPAVLLIITLWRQHSQASLWSRTINSSLLVHLLDNTGGRQQRLPWAFLLLAWILASISMAGPVWKKQPQPVEKKEDSLVLIQDLSLSFYAQDLAPNRLTRAQHKLTDILEKRKEGTTALVVYSGDAHTVAPLTDDTRTISAMIPSLSPGIMPSYGSNVTHGVEIALELFKATAISRGTILLLTDEVSAEDVKAVTDLLQGSAITLSVIGVGTEDGGPIPKNDGGFWKDDSGTIIIPRMDRTLLQELATKNRGRYSDIQLTDADIDSLLAADSILPGGDTFLRTEREFDQWQEQGAWLLLLVLPVALMAFRKGWILGIMLAMSLWGQDCQAMSWNDLWQRPDQQAARILASDPQRAAELFQSPQWKGTASYRAGKFEEAAQDFDQSDNGDALYNRGNSLAKAGSLDEAIKAYDQALAINPDLEDARFNRELVEKLVAQQKQEQEQKQQNQQEEEKPPEDEQKRDGKQQEDNTQSSSQNQQGEQQKGEQEPDSDQSEEKQKDTENQQQDPPGDKEKEGGAEKETQPLKQQNTDGKEDEAKPNSSGDLESPEQPNREEQQALEQWLRQVPDDPGGLLRRKFEYQSQINRGRRNTEPNGKRW